MDLFKKQLAFLNQDKSKQMKNNIIRITDKQLTTKEINQQKTQNPKAKLYQCPDSRFIT
ncbi:hypothetical protein HanPSC8_Chr10g0412411 [Helianthus annuus]|nr:hypothetical protein HanPSC8_Chr10g0412411 [Helianthus annuus]